MNTHLTEEDSILRSEPIGLSKSTVQKATAQRFSATTDYIAKMQYIPRYSGDILQESDYTFPISSYSIAGGSIEHCVVVEFF